MKRIYRADIERGELFFNEMPLKGKEDPIIPSKATEITVVRYGSSMDNMRWYFCSEYFCLRDKLAILPKDFTGTIARNIADGTPLASNSKPENTCPFCKGGQITQSKGAVEGKTVVWRHYTKSSGAVEEYHYIGFLSGEGHPTKKSPPCCYTGKKILRLNDKEKGAEKGYFEDLKPFFLNSGKPTIINFNAPNATSATSASAFVTSASMLPYVPDPQPYDVIRQSINSPGYIFVKSNVHPLKPGQFGILPGPFDKYFTQRSDSFIGEAKGTGTLRLRSKGDGFGRIGVERGYRDTRIGKENSFPTESLFAVLAPLLQRESIEQVRARFLELFTGEAGVRLFVTANFGNLVHEFHQPSEHIEGLIAEEFNQSATSLSIGPSRSFVEWVKAKLRMSVTPTNQYAVERIYNSYNRFIAFLEDPKQAKELRHFAGILAEPGLMAENTRGLQLIVLEWAMNDDKHAPQIRCSPYGFSLARHKENDFAFVWRDSKGYYELLFYTKNTLAAGSTSASNETTWRWEHDNYRDWPPIAMKRIREYMSQCASSYRSLYTPQQGIDSNALITISDAHALVGRLPIGIVRDSYNHACFLLYNYKSGLITKNMPLVPLPIVDDGSLSLETYLY
jgi:hypothetical protein